MGYKNNRNKIRKMKKNLLIAALFLAFTIAAKAQIGFGFVGGNDIYQRYTNPEDGSESRSAGNAILNLHFGPKIWVGGQTFSVSVETYANWGSTALSLKDYKGMGAAAFPLMAKLNFGGNSGFNSELTSGWSIGGGYQISKTELYGLNEFSAQEGFVRDFYPVMIGEISYGYGISGFVTEVFARYGWNTETHATTLNVGVSYNLNIIGLKKLVRKLEKFDN